MACSYESETRSTVATKGGVTFRHDTTRHDTTRHDTTRSIDRWDGCATEPRTMQSHERYSNTNGVRGFHTERVSWCGWGRRDDRSIDGMRNGETETNTSAVAFDATLIGVERAPSHLFQLRVRGPPKFGDGLGSEEWFAHTLQESETRSIDRFGTLHESETKARTRTKRTRQRKQPRPSANTETAGSAIANSNSNCKTTLSKTSLVLVTTADDLIQLLTDDCALDCSVVVVGGVGNDNANANDNANDNNSRDVHGTEPTPPRYGAVRSRLACRPSLRAKPLRYGTVLDRKDSYYRRKQYTTSTMRMEKERTTGTAVRNGASMPCRS
eukprot:CAMPEP_0168245198 /NCGR_PEP_ID=MMETSP0140_2-20121125/25035_1 /TAXON_ID=44445 /ORGANISM="Pseudo-nitzschia australis, Strain 10249 10 AB" /LENGTH=325 /DNA_ID=CAMNT_0008180769 /DNA_START=187 /DNA_END=1161 /DNA_ORIENTATION=+